MAILPETPRGFWDDFAPIFTRPTFRSCSPSWSASRSPYSPGPCRCSSPCIATQLTTGASGDGIAHRPGTRSGYSA